MKLRYKILLSTIISVFVLALTYFGSITYLTQKVDINKYAQTLFNDIEKETGFKVSCEDIKFIKSYSPYLKIHLHHSAVMYPDNTVFLQIKDSDLKIKIIPLLFKNIIIKDTKLSRPIVNITLYEDFSTSLEKYFKNVNLINTNGFKFHSVINDSLLENYKIKYNDKSIDKTFYLEGKELILKNINPEKKAHIILEGSLFEGEKEYIKYNLNLITDLNNKNFKFTFSPFKTIFESNVQAKITGDLKSEKEHLNGSLKVEDLSLKLKDIVSSKNSADILFNGQEAQFNAIIHTSASDSAILKGKYAYGSKKYIDINTNAKNINLENLSKIISSTTKVLNIKNPVNNIIATGIMDAEFNLTSDFKKLKSKGSAVIKNAVLKYSDLPYSVHDINAKLNFENNNISIEEAKAKINNTPVIVQGNINEDLTFNLKSHSENLDLKKLINTFPKEKEFPLNINGGKLAFESEIKGKINKTVETISKININDAHFRENKYNIPVNAKLITLNLKTKDKKYFGEINCNNLSALYNKIPLDSDNFKFSFDDKNIKLTDNEINIIKSPVIIKGDIKDYINNPVINIDYSGKINAENLASVLKDYIKIPYKAKGTIFSAGKIFTSKDKINIKSQLKADENDYISYLLIKEILKKPSLVNIDCELKNNNLLIKDISLKENIENPKKIINVNGNVILDKEIEFNNLKVSVPNYITAASDFFGGEEISFKSDLSVNNKLSVPAIKGNAKINYYNIKKLMTSIKNADVSFNNNNIRITAPNVQISNSSFNIVADVTKENNNNFTISNLQLNSLYLDLGSLFSAFENKKNLFENSVIDIKHGTATIADFKLYDMKAKDISSDFQLEKNILKLTDLNANAYSGHIQGKINYNIHSNLMNMDITGKSIDIKNSFNDLFKIQDNLSGKTDFKAALSLMPGDDKTILRTINGRVDFEALNGGMGSLGKFEYYLSAKNIFYHGFLNTTLNRIADALTHDKTEQYKRAKGSVLLQNAYMITDGIQTTGTKMSLYIKGRQNLLTNQANFNLYGRITDDFRRKLGSFWNVSLSELINGQSSKQDIILTSLPKNIEEKIPPIYNYSGNTNLFKVNLAGDLSEVNCINSFEWIAGNEDFSDTEIEQIQLQSEPKTEIKNESTSQSSETVRETETKEVTEIIKPETKEISESEKNENVSQPKTNKEEPLPSFSDIPEAL